MARITFGATGPDFFITKNDLVALSTTKKLSFPLNESDNIFGELILTSYRPNRVNCPDGGYRLIDCFCSEEYLLKKIKKRDGTIKYELKANRIPFFRNVDKFLKKEIELMGSRCRYDRFSIRIQEY